MSGEPAAAEEFYTHAVALVQPWVRRDLRLHTVNTDKGGADHQRKGHPCP